MPHVIVKLWPGPVGGTKSAAQRAETVYEPDIKGKWDTLTKKPGYRI